MNDWVKYQWVQLIIVPSIRHCPNEKKVQCALLQETIELLEHMYDEPIELWTD